MKKFKKIKNKTPLKSKLYNTEIRENESQIIEEKRPEDDFIYVLNSKIINSINPEIKDNEKETLKRKNKSIDISTDHNQNKFDIDDLPAKKTKKKLIKKKKKSKKTEIMNYCEPMIKNTENLINNETPTPNGNDQELEYFYLIDYQSKNKYSNSKNNKDKSPQKEVEDKYNTFHENEITPMPENNINTVEKFKKLNFTISATNSSKKFNTNNNNINKINVSETIKPEKLNFEEAENDRHSKIKKIRFRERKENKTINETTNKNQVKVEKNLNEIDNVKGFHVMYRDNTKKKRKILTKKRAIIKNSKTIMIQSMWRKYKIVKLIKLYKNINKLRLILNKIINDRLKNNLLILFEQFNLNDNKNKKIKSIKRMKKRKLKIKNSSPTDLKDNLIEKPQNKTLNYNENSDNNSDKNKNGNNTSNILLEDRKLFINNDNMEITNSSIRTFETNNNVNSSYTNNPINTDNNCDNNKIEEISSQNKKELSLKNIKIKPKLKQFKIGIQAKTPDKIINLGYSIDSKFFSPVRKYPQPEAKYSNLSKIYVKPLESSASFKKINIPFKNRNKFPKEALIKCNIENVYFNNNQKGKNVNYYKKVIGEKNSLKNKNKKNKNDFSIIKFIFDVKDIISKTTRKNYYSKIIKNLKLKSILKNLVNLNYNKKINIMKNIFNEYRLKARILKYIEQINNNRKKDFQIFQNKTIIIKDKKTNNNISNKYDIERNQLFITDELYNKNKKLKNKKIHINQFNNNKLEITKNIYNIQINQKLNNDNKYIIDDIIQDFNIKSNPNKENKFNYSKNIIDNNIKELNIKSNSKKQIKFDENKLLIFKNISNINIEKEIKQQNNIIDKILDNRFIINRKYKKEILFNENKLIINKKISHIEFKNKINKNIFIIQKVNKINIIKKNNNINQKHIITKIINKSPILSQKYIINNNLVINKINNINLKGITKIKNNLIINKVNNGFIIDDIYEYNANNKNKFYKSMIKNNIDNLVIVRKISHLNIRKQNKNNINNYIICKQIKNNVIGKYLNHYEFNDNKLIITKVINYLFKNKGVDKIKIRIIYSTCLLKIKSVLLKNIRNLIYPILINIMKKYSFCNHLCKFNKTKINFLKIILIHNLKNKKLEEKYKKYSNNKFNILIINKVIKYNILSNNKIHNNSNNNEIIKKNYTQLPRHYIIHKVKLFSMNTEKKDKEKNKNFEEEFLEKLYEKKYKNFIKDNVISRNINIFFGNKNQEIDISEKGTPKNENNENFHKDYNRIYISRFKMYNSKRRNNFITDNTNTNNTNNNEIQVYDTYNSSYICNNKTYEISESKSNENENENENNTIEENIEEDKSSAYFEKNEVEEKTPEKLNDEKEEEYEEEEEIEEIEEEEEESIELGDVKDILINCINKKNDILNNKLFNAFCKWKKIKDNKGIHKIKRIKENNEDICENGGINRSKKIFIIYRKYSNSFYITKKKILRKWKKIVDEEKNNVNNENINEEVEEKELDEIEEKSEYEEEEEEFEDYEEENEEEEIEK